METWEGLEGLNLQVSILRDLGQRVEVLGGGAVYMNTPGYN